MELSKGFGVKDDGLTWHPGHVRDESRSRLANEEPEPQKAVIAFFDADKRDTFEPTRLTVESLFPWLLREIEDPNRKPVDVRCAMISGKLAYEKKPSWSSFLQSAQVALGVVSCVSSAWPASFCPAPAFIEISWDVLQAEQRPLCWDGFNLQEVSAFQRMWISSQQRDLLQERQFACQACPSTTASNASCITMITDICFCKGLYRPSRWSSSMSNLDTLYCIYIL